MPPRTIVEADGFSFVFAHDPADPAMLHIFARHLTTIEDALAVWFDEDSDETSGTSDTAATRHATTLTPFTGLG